MGTLLNTLKVLEAASKTQSTANGVGGLLSAGFKTLTSSPTAIPGGVSRSSASTPELPTIPLVSTVPQGMQPELKNSALKVLQVALQQKSPGVPIPNLITVGGAIAGIIGSGTSTDVGDPAFKSAVSISVFNQLVPTVRALALKSGVSPTKINTLINVTSSVVNLALGKAIARVPPLYGTTVLKPTEYVSFAQDALSTVSTEFVAAKLDTTALQQVAIESTLTKTLEVPVELSLGPGETIVGNAPSVISQDMTHVPSTNKKVFLRSSSDRSEVFFEHQPIISITDTATYSQMAPVHMPTAFNTFTANPPVKYSMTDVKLFSRTPEEASENMVILARLRGWLKPTFGISSILEGEGLESASDALQAREKRAIPTNQGNPLRALEYRNGIAGAQNEVTSKLPGVLVNATAVNAPKYTTTTALDPVNQALGNAARIRYPQSKVGTGYASNTNSELTNRILSSNQRQVITNQGNPLRALEYKNGIAGAQYETTSGKTAASSLLPASTETEVRQLGSPPEILYFYAYTNEHETRTASSDNPHNIYRVPVAIESIAYSYPNDVDYIPSSTGIPWPAVMTLTITLISMHSPQEVEQFSLDDYKTGRLVGW